MQLRYLFLLLILAAIAVFAALNWSAFTAPTSLSLVFGTVQAPLGVLLLGLIALLAVVFLTFVVYLQTTVLMESRRSARELGAQRDLADKAEASRFTALQGYMEERLARVETQAAAQKAELIGRIEASEQAIVQALEHSSNGLAAHIAELDDRIERGGGPGGGSPVIRR